MRSRGDPIFSFTVSPSLAPPLHPYPLMEPDTLEGSKRFTKLPPFYGVIYIRFAFSRFSSKFPAKKEIRKVAVVVSIYDGNTQKQTARSRRDDSENVKPSLEMPQRHLFEAIRRP